MDFAHRIFFLDIGYFGGFRHRKVIYYTPYIGLIKLVKTANTQTENIRIVGKLSNGKVIVEKRVIRYVISAADIMKYAEKKEEIGK